MDGCRLNMSHCSHDLGRRLVGLVRQISREAGREIPIGADLRGPKLRIGDVVGGEVRLVDGQILWLTPNPAPTDARTASVEYPFLAEDLHPGDPVLMNDGLLVLRVEELRPPEVACRVVKGGILRSRKGVNLPGIPLRLPPLTAKDLQDMEFAVGAGVDFLYLSYVCSADHVAAVRTSLARRGSSIPLIAKIERQEGVDRLAEIVAVSDGVCIARSDLGIELREGIGLVPWVQKDVAYLCRQAGKRSIVGGQLLASMASSPIPLRSEVADLAAVVTDGFDAVILSDETASGDYPVEAVRTAAQVMATAEQMLASLRKSPSDGQLS